jgi:hypothetical protein
MKTTVEIADSLDQPRAGTSFRLKPFGFRGEEQLTHDWSSIREMAYSGRGGAQTDDGNP